MNVLRTVTTTVFGLALMGAVFSPGAKADEWNRKTVMTFSGPVEIPGVHLKGWGVLPAGTYVFKIMDSHVRPPHRPDLQQGRNAGLRHHPGHPELSPQGDRQDRSYFPGAAGRSAGGAPGLVLSRQKLGRGIRVPEGESNRAGQGRPTRPFSTRTADLPLEVEKPILTLNEPEVAQLREAPVKAIQPTGEEVEIAAVVTPPPAAELQPDTAPAQVAMAQLPQTSSPLPLIALFGLLALGGAWALRLVQ